MTLEPLETAEGSEYSGCHQLSVFLENRLGQLLRLTRLLDGDDIHILGLTVEGSVDCAIVRMMVDHPDLGRRKITEAGFAVAESELIVVELPPGKRGILTVCTALISAEVNINYAYPIFPATTHSSCLAIQVDNIAQASRVLRVKKFRVLDQHELH